MALPQQVIEQLGKEPSQDQGWAFGILLFSGSVLVLVIAIYFGMSVGYDRYLQSQIQNTQAQITQLNQSISPTDQANLINFYSQISNVKTLLKKHVLTSQFFTWLEKNTEVNVYYQSLTLATGNKVTIVGHATTENDINQQVAIYENSPEVKSVSVSNVGLAQTTGGWTFSAILTMNPSVFLSANP
jgi:hypothetical protein